MKKMKKQTVEFVSLNVAYWLTEYDTESVTKDYNLPFFFAQKPIQVFVSNLYLQIYSPIATNFTYK